MPDLNRVPKVINQVFDILDLLVFRATILGLAVLGCTRCSDIMDNPDNSNNVLRQPCRSHALRVTGARFGHYKITAFLTQSITPSWSLASNSQQ